MTIDEILAAMPEPAAEGDRDYLVIDPATRTITVPDSGLLFGVTGDELADRKYFLCPRYVGDGLDLASMFLTVYFRNANGVADGYAVTDVAVNGDYITFSWELTEKVTKYMGPVQFSVCADLPNTDKLRRPDWNTTTATGEVLEGLHPDLADVTEESSDLATQLRAQIAASTAAVEAAGAAQIEAVETAAEAETAAAVAAIQAQGEATKASIPADYSALAATVDRLSRDRAAAIVCQAEGESIQVQDASNDPLQGLRIFGRSTQDGVPTPENPVEIVSTEKPVVTVCGKNLLKNGATSGTLKGVTFTVNEDGSFTAKGTSTGDVYFGIDFAVENVLPGIRYRLCGCPAGGSGTTYRLYAQTSDGKNFAGDIGMGTSFTGTADQWQVIFVIYGVKTVDFTVRPMLRLATIEDDTYEPYKGQTLAITTPGSLPGIPVTSGGNYTDENGQQWICDEVDLARGVYVQRVRNLVFSGEETFDNTWYPVAIYHIHSPAPHVNITHNLVRSSHFNNVSCGNTLGTSVAFGNLDKLGFASSDDLAAYFAEQYAQNNPVTVQYVIATPIETALTDAEIQAFRALHSCKGNTTVLNDAGAHMILEYAADPKTYIDNKIAALVAANN